MNAQEILRELKRPGMVLLWIPELDTYLPVMKAALRDALASLFPEEGESLDAHAYWEEGGSFIIDDFGARVDVLSESASSV